MLMFFLIYDTKLQQSLLHIIIKTNDNNRYTS